MRGNPNMKPVAGKLTYSSNNREFTSDIFIDLEHYMTFFSTDTDQSDLLESINNCTKELRRISNTIAMLKETPEEEENEEEDV